MSDFGPKYKRCPGCNRMQWEKFPEYNIHNIGCPELKPDPYLQETTHECFDEQPEVSGE